MKSRTALPMHVAIAFAGLMLIVAFALVDTDASSGSRSSSNSTFMPESGDEVLARLPAGLAMNERDAGDLSAMRIKLEENPKDVETATTLATRYIDAARKTGALRYLGYAEAALAPWWHGRESAPPRVLMARATVLQARHEFEASLSDLSKVLKARPRDAAAWLTTSTIFKVLGRASDALAACRPLARTAGALLTAACRANASAMTPHAGSAHTALTSLLDRSSDKPAGHRQWALWVHATLSAELGHDAMASDSFKRALNVTSPDLNLVLSYADFLLDTDRPKDALEFLDDAAGPGRQTHTSVTLRREMAATALQRRSSADALAQLRMHFQELALRGDGGQAGDEARFEFYVLGNTPRALKLALRNFEVHREPRDARLLMDVASASGIADEANARWLLAQAGLTLPKSGYANSPSSLDTAGSGA